MVRSSCTPVLMIALDAAESTLIERWTADGTMPTPVNRWMAAAVTMYRRDGSWRSVKESCRAAGARAGDGPGVTFFLLSVAVGVAGNGAFDRIADALPRIATGIPGLVP